MQRMNMHGVVDLGAYKTATGSAQPGQGAAQGTAARTVVDVTEATFQAEVLERSKTVPVVVDFWATWCGPCKQLSPILEKLAVSDGGRWVLAKVDVDANQRLAAALQVQSIPTVVAVVAGQAIPLFNGAVPEPTVRQYLDELMRVAAEQFGIGGGGAAADVDQAGPVDPGFLAATEALDRGDLDGAATAFREMLARDPQQADAKAGLAQVELFRRIQGLDARQIRMEAAERPDDAAAQCRAADLDLMGGHVEDAFSRLIDAIRRMSGTDRDAVRTHLLGLFEAVGADDLRVAKARSALASALF